MSVVEEFTGSCLCGTVSYKIVGEANKFYHCHCQRCRKATGTGHASNLILMQPPSAEWTSGEEHIGRYKVPEAKRFAVWFCQQCGSNLPRVPDDLSMVVIPAGSLDMKPDKAPEARIFYADGTKWSCQDTDVPSFERYPE